MVLITIVEPSGVFDYLAEGCARLARGSGALLLANTFLLGAIVTTLLSLDAMIIVMTPIIYALTRPATRSIAVHVRLRVRRQHRIIDAAGQQSDQSARVQ